jgi:SAM-dependent methyltransferase
MSDISYPDEGNAWCAAVEDTSWWFQHRNRYLLDLMRRYPPETPLYDVGGGNGVVAAALSRAGYRTIVIEPGEVGVHNARSRGVEAHQATLETAGLPGGTVASIGMFDVLEHIDDDVAFLAQARTYLRHGGRIYLTVPAYQSLWSAEDDHAKHFRRYTRHKLTRVLEAAGFQVERISYMFAFLPLPILLFRSVPYRIGLTHQVTASGVARDHGARGGVARAVLDSVLRLERAILRRVGSLPFGGSVVAVARA